MNRHPLGDYLYQRTIELFRLRHPENYQRVWVEGRAPVNELTVVHNFKVTYAPGGYEFRFNIEEFQGRAACRSDGRQLWVGLPDGRGALNWMPENKNCRFASDELAPRLKDTLDRALLLEDLSNL